MIVINSSPLINLGKQGRLEIFKNCFGKILIAYAVYQEVIKKTGSPEAVAVKKAIDDRWVIVEKVPIHTTLNTLKIAQAEKEAISLATKHNSLLIIDDDIAKRYAAILGVEAHGTLYVLYLACIKNIIKQDNAKNIFNTIVKDGFYLSTDIYINFMELLNSLKK